IKEVISILKTIDNEVRGNIYAAGFISYEAAPAFDPALKAKDLSSFPLCWFGLYNKVSIINPSEYKRKKYEIDNWISSINKGKYYQDIKQIKEYIAGGYTYQVNYTYRLTSKIYGDPFSFFLELVDKQKTNYAAYIDIGDFVICSVSPELFFKLEGDSIISRPMKGTANRGRYIDEDIEKANRLHRSIKDRAENTMIVDMIRNDLGRISDTGSVQVESLYDIEKYQTVLQMTSSVRARTNASISRIFTAMFPCASITGAPKYQTTKIISEIEATPRKVYTGCIGFIMPGRKAQFNVAIRTVLIDRILSQAEYGVGGGIVWESDEREEYEESRTKFKVLTEKKLQFNLLETILWTPQHGYFLLDYHLRRLKDSAKYFSFSYNEDHIEQKLDAISDHFSDKLHKIRLLLAKDGNITTTSDVIQNDSPKGPIRLAFSKIHVDSSDPMLYHKTTNRRMYERAKKIHRDCDDVIFLNECKEITETCIYNLVLKMNRQYITPPVSCGLLPGTFRAWLLDKKEIKEKAIKLREFKNCDEIFVINSLRKWQKAILI
ncbi:MAG: bifunctional anthranilate synthase component I family protein/class IV aminotransferase, partial [Calditrichia bacterium]|nr:bifunctional anthranilate synthase component I family protein/class IV aminotransferase [Calditrichia bacterium]